MTYTVIVWMEGTGGKQRGTERRLGMADAFPLMIRQVATDYASAPDVRTMTGTDILFFYRGLLPGLRRASATDGH